MSTSDSTGPRGRQASPAIPAGLAVSARLAASLGLLLAGTAATLAASPDALVNQLGSEEYSQRLTAQQSLQAAGQSALAALKAGLQHPDAEVRRACRRLLAGALDQDYERRLKAFVGGQANSELQLPSWQRFGELVGDDPDSRRLFAEMQRAEPGLLESAEAGGEPVSEAVRVRLQQVYQLLFNRNGQQPQQPSLGTLAAILFVTADDQLEIQPDLLDNTIFANILQRSVQRAAFTDGELKAPMRGLLAAWLLRPSGARLFTYKLQLAVQNKASAGVELSIRAIGQRQGIPPTYRVNAIHALGKLGGQEYMAIFAGLLDDKSECSRRIVRKNNQAELVSVQMRDVALAWLLHFNKQDFGEYGMPQAKSAFDRLQRTPTYTTVSASYFYFNGKDEREAALAKWKEYVAEHPLPALPELPESARRPALASNAPKVPNPLAPQAVKPGGGAEPEEAEGRGLQPADRLLARKLGRSRQLIAEGSFAEATRLLGEVLAIDGDFTFEPNRGGALSRGLKAEAEQLIGELPPAGREAYQLQFGADARLLLQQAMDAGDIPGIAAVTEKYSFTNAGLEASYLLGSHYLNRGHPLRAAQYLQRVRERSPNAWQPQLSIKLATCWLLAGVSEDAAAAVLDARRYAPQGVTFGGTRSKPIPDDREQALGWLESFIRSGNGTMQRDEWLVYRGSLDRSRRVDDINPYLDGEPLSVNEAALREPIAHLQQDRLQQFKATLPSAAPLVIDNLIIARGASDLVAVDAETGAIRWRSLLDDSLQWLINNQLPNQDRQQVLRGGLDRRLWQNATFGGLSSDGKRVFAIEGLHFGDLGVVQRLVVTPDGRRRLDPDGPKSYNRLACYDVRTGKLRWEVGGPLGRGQLEMAGTFFLGPPLPLGGRLYVLAEQRKQVKLFELNGEQGTRLWELVVHAAESVGNITVNPMAIANRPESDAHRVGASPSCSQGVLVCPVTADRFVAIDLTTRKVLWIYHLPGELSPFGGGAAWMAVNPFQLKQYQQVLADDDHRWLDASITVAESVVLLTPPRSGQLLCLDLKSGRLLWQAARRDGMYVAGIWKDRAILVGRSSVWALRLADGEPAWPEPVGLPPGSVPSGRGYLGVELCFVPLSSAEVAAIDVDSGRLLARSRSPAAIVPGNLVPLSEGILSQSPLGLWRFESLAQRQDELEAQLSANQNQAPLLAGMGEVALFDGRLDEAIDRLSESISLKPNPDAQQLLVAALLDGLHQDFERYHPQVVRLQPLLGEAANQPDFIGYLAEAYQRAGDVTRAMRYYLTLVESESDRDKLQYVAAMRQVRRDRWLQARLAETWQRADEAQRKQLLTQLQPYRDQVRNLEFFADLPISTPLRMQRAAAAAAGGRRLAADYGYRRVLLSEDPAQQPAALVALARMLQPSHPVEAARMYEQLRTEFAEQPVADGRTAVQLTNAVPDGSTLKRLLGDNVWPAGQVTKQVGGKPTSFYRYAVSRQLTSPHSPPLHISIDSGGRTLSAVDEHGQLRCELKLDPPKIKAQDANRKIVANWGINSSSFTYCEAGVFGNLLICWTVNRVCAIDLLQGKGKLLWDEPTVTKPPPQNGMIQLRALPMRNPQQPSLLRGTKRRHLVVTPDAVVFQQDRKLVALDPLSGNVLWSRDGHADDSDLTGDREMILVTPPGQAESEMLDVKDGRVLGHCPAVELAHRAEVIGRRVVVWRPTPNGLQLSLFDPPSKRTLWSETFPANSSPFVTDRREMAIMTPDGQIHLVELDSGRSRMLIDVAWLPRRENIVLVPRRGRYEILVNQKAAEKPAAANQPVVVNAFTMNYGSSVYAANGTLLSVDAESGKLQWSHAIANQSLDTNQPREAPVLTMLHQFRRLTNGRSYRTESSMLCLDRRSGEELHSATNSGTNYMFMTVADLEKKTVAISSRSPTVTFTFAAKP